MPIFGASIGLVQFKFIAADLGPNSLVEAGVDDLEILYRTSTNTPDAQPVPPRFALLGARPNPARGATEIEWRLPSSSEVRLSLYDVSGRLVRTLADGVYGAGLHRTSWDGRDAAGRPVSGGAYYCRMEAGEFRATRTVLVAR